MTRYVRSRPRCQRRVTGRVTPVLPPPSAPSIPNIPAPPPSSIDPNHTAASPLLNSTKLMRRAPTFRCSRRRAARRQARQACPAAADEPPADKPDKPVAAADEPPVDKPALREEECPDGTALPPQTCLAYLIACRVTCALPSMFCF